MTAQAAPETLSPEQMEQAQGRLQSILSAAEKASNTPVPEPPKPGIVRKRAVRSDAGKPRAKGTPTRTADFQWRVEDLMQAERDLILAQQRKDRAWAEYCLFVHECLDSLTSKPPAR